MRKRLHPPQYSGAEYAGASQRQGQALSERVDVLSRRSIREKLLCYFRQQAGKSGGDAFTLPFSFSVLADYIATDRSAMMRELRHLKEQGFLRTDGVERSPF